MTLSSHFAVAQTDKNFDSLLSRSWDLYGKKRYKESLELLNSAKKQKDQNLNWYYYYGLNSLRLKNYEDAESSFNSYIKGGEVSAAARAYYFLGLTQFYTGEYDKSINTLEISMDLSQDAKLDRSIDLLIDKAIKYRNYYEKYKKTNIHFLIGYMYDSNAIGQSPALSSTNLTGHILTYGASVSYRAVDLYNFVFEPSLTYIDNYTLDQNFKSNSTIQSLDIMQILFSAPIVFYFDEEESDTRYEFSLNAFNGYMPISGAARDLYMTSYFFKGRLEADLTKFLNINLKLTASQDKAKNFLSADDDATGFRGDAEIALNQYFSKQKADLSGLQYDIFYSIKTAEGVNARYAKSKLGLSYFYSISEDLHSSFGLNAEQTRFSQRATPREDMNLSIDCSVSKELDEFKNVIFLLGAEQNQSNVDLYKYSDFKFGVTYTQSFSF